MLNSNEYLDIDYTAPVAEFRAHGLDAGVLTFPSIHPRYYYVRLDEDGYVVKATEKKPVSRHATPGFTWIAKGADFVAAAQSMIHKDAKVDGHFYISLTLNEMVLRQKRIGAFAVEARRYHPLKSQRPLTAYGTETMDVPRCATPS